MALHTQLSENGKILTIQINGRFVLNMNRDFREAYQSQDKTGMEYQIDLSQAEYMDSAALGMLLMIKEHAEAKGGTVTIIHPTEETHKIIKLAHFDKLFTIMS